MGLLDETVLITSLAVFTLLAGLCSIVFNKLKLPPLIGYLIAGIIIANLWHISDEGHSVVDILSDMGMVMLMFCIGLELNLKKLRKTGSFAIKVGLIQLPMMVVGGFLVGSLMGFNTIQSIALGAIISGSSTATIMAVLKSQGNLDKEHIETLVLITIIEDIAQVIMLSMLTPMFAGSSMDANSLVVMIVSILVFMAVSIFVGIRFIPRIINWVADNVSTEVLTIFSVGLAFGMALLATYVGLSIAIGAFLMGVMVASSRNSEEINIQIEPMKNLFMAMFFISVGMEISLGTLADNIVTIVIIFLTFLVCKVLSVTFGYWISDEDTRTGFISAVSLVAMGEFAFIIAKEAFDYGVVDNSYYTSVIGAALVSMIVLPILTKYSPRVFDSTMAHCPAPLHRFFDKANSFRDETYMRVYATSRKSQNALRRSMAHSYINILLIVLIEAVFAVGYTDAVHWLLESFGGTELLWNLFILVVNFLVLSLPIFFLVSNVKYLDELVIIGAKHLSSRGRGAEPSKMYEKFLGINTYLLVILIDFVILMVVPNPLGVSEHILVLLIAGVILIGFFYKRRKDQMADFHDDDDE